MPRAPQFWWHAKGNWASTLLAPLGVFYGTVSGIRMHQTGAKAKLPIICVGNFTAGGAGKTPTAIAICGILKSLDIKPVFLSRGYGGTFSGPAKVLPDNKADQVGDEPLLLARHAPTIIAHDRVMGAEYCASLGDVIIMDDGFQNPSLYKNLSIIVVDETVGIGNGMCMPAGPLRAPLTTQLKLADIILLVKNKGEQSHLSIAALRNSKPTIEAEISLNEPENIDQLYLPFCGIGRPEKFYSALTQANYRFYDQLSFDDHHNFTAQDAQKLLDIAHETNAKLITTLKDMARLKQTTDPILKELFNASQAIDLNFKFKEPQKIKQIIETSLAPHE